MSVHWCIGWRRDASMIVRVLKFRFQPINSIPLPRRRMREWGGRKRYIRRKYIRSGASRTRVARRKACLWIYSLSAKTDNAPRGRLAPGQPLIAPSLARLCGAAANLARPSRRRVRLYGFANRLYVLVVLTPILPPSVRGGVTSCVRGTRWFVRVNNSRWVGKGKRSTAERKGK